MMREFIKKILKKNFGEKYQDIYDCSPLIQYLDLKMGAINGDTKTRRSLANIYAIYSLVFSYKKEFFNKKDEYKKFDGWEYTVLQKIYQSMYGGAKLQNHALNNRVNNEFSNKISKDDQLIIQNNGKYLLFVKYLYVDDIDISNAVIQIINEYISLLKKKDKKQLMLLENIKKHPNKIEENKKSIKALLCDNAEARLFEIISFAILKNHYKHETYLIGKNIENLTKHILTLYKTGRTNANDGGIDFVMKPLGTFFQVTEVENYDKYLLDMDKVLHYPITFVVKTLNTKDHILREMNEYIEIKTEGMEVLKNRYKNAIEDVITINELLKWLDEFNKDDIISLIKDIVDYYLLEMNLENGI